jgi:hypothetical protein
MTAKLGTTSIASSEEEKSQFPESPSIVSKEEDFLEKENEEKMEKELPESNT